MKIPRRFAKFCIVGLTGVIINLGILYILKESFGFLYFASIIAIELSIISNFILNDIWTFNDKRKQGKKNFLYRLIKWNIARGGTSLFFNWLIFVLLIKLGFYYIIAQAIGIIFATLFAYLLSLNWIWN